MPPARGPRSRAPQRGRAGERSPQSAAETRTAATTAAPGTRGVHPPPPAPPDRGLAGLGGGERGKRGVAPQVKHRVCGPQLSSTGRDPAGGCRTLFLRPLALPPLTCGRSGTGAGGVASVQACPADDKHLTQRRALQPARYIRRAAYPGWRLLSQSESGGHRYSDTNWPAAPRAVGRWLKGTSVRQPRGLAPCGQSE